MLIIMIAIMTCIMHMTVYSSGATVISKLLVNNCMIELLGIRNNDIGDDGITAIATALTKSRISELSVYGCSITLTGARSLAKLLSINHSIRELRLSGNPITTEGAHLILQSVVNNEACQADIKIDDDYSSNSEAQMLISILEGRRRRIKTNMVSHYVT